MQYVPYNPINHRFKGDYRGLRAYISDNPLLKLAQEWGIYPFKLYALCRDYGVSLIHKAIELTKAKPDWHFQLNKLPVIQQRGRYCMGIINKLIAQLKGEVEEAAAEVVAEPEPLPAAPVEPEPPVVEPEPEPEYQPNTGNETYDEVVKTVLPIYRHTAERLEVKLLTKTRVVLLAPDDATAKMCGFVSGFRNRLAEGFEQVMGVRPEVEVV